MATIATRLTADGILYTNGSFDEVSQIKNSVTPDTVFTSELDEVTIHLGSVAKRETADGKLLVSNHFDEVTKIT